MSESFLTVLYAITSSGALVLWAAAMYFWCLLNYSSKPGKAQKRRLAFGAFVAMLVFGLVSWGLRETIQFRTG